MVGNGWRGKLMPTMGNQNTVPAVAFVDVLDQWLIMEILSLCLFSQLRERLEMYLVWVLSLLGRSLTDDNKV